MATVGLINKAYVSALDSMLDTREINSQITDVYNEDQLTDILGLADRKKPTKQPIYYTFINESLFKLLDTTGATVSNSGTATVTTACTVATSGNVRVGDLILFPTGAVVGQVQSISTSSSIDTIVVKSVGGGNITHTAGEKLSIFSQASGERSVSPSNIRFGVTKYSNKVQIFRETSLITDVQNAATLEVQVNGKDGYAVKDHFEKKILLKGKINAAFWAGDMSATSFSDASPSLVDQTTLSTGGGGGAVQTTRGVDKYTTAYGVSTTVASLGTVALTDVDAQLDALTAARAPKSFLVAGSKSTLRKFDVLWKNLGSSGVTSARLMVDGKEIDFECQKVSYGGYEMSYANMPIFDNPNIFSQTSIAKSAYYIPFDYKVKVEGGGYDNAIQVRYTPNQYKFGNDMIGEIHGGALSTVNPSGQVAEMRMDYITTQGLEVLGAQFFGKQKVS